MSKIKNGGLDQYGTKPFEQQQSETAGVEGVKPAFEDIRRSMISMQSKNLAAELASSAAEQLVERAGVDRQCHVMSEQS